MSKANDLTPPIDSSVEEETIGFDFGPALASGVTITSIESVSCGVHTGADASAATRLIGIPSIVASQATGTASAGVSQIIGNMVAGVTYVLQCVVNTSDNQSLSLWTRIKCVAPA